MFEIDRGHWYLKSLQERDRIWVVDSQVAIPRIVQGRVHYDLGFPLKPQMNIRSYGKVAEARIYRRNPRDGDIVRSDQSSSVHFVNRLLVLAPRNCRSCTRHRISARGFAQVRLGFRPGSQATE